MTRISREDIEIENLKNQKQDGLCHFVFREVNGECGVTRT